MNEKKGKLKWNSKDVETLMSFASLGDRRPPNGFPPTWSVICMCRCELGDCCSKGQTTQVAPIAYYILEPDCLVCIDIGRSSMIVSYQLS